MSENNAKSERTGGDGKNVQPYSAVIKELTDLGFTVKKKVATSSSTVVKLKDCDPPIKSVYMPPGPEQQCDPSCPQPCDPCCDPAPPAPTAPCRCPPEKLPCCCRPPPKPQPCPCPPAPEPCLPMCPEPCPPKKDPCPPFKCPFPKSEKKPCNICPCDDSGTRPCYGYKCIKKEKDEPCTDDPNCPDEITLECKMKDGSTRCVPYICKEKAEKILCNKDKDKIYGTMEECIAACNGGVSDYERGRQDMLCEISKCTKVCIPKPLPNCEEICEEKIILPPSMLDELCCGSKHGCEPMPKICLPPVVLEPTCCDPPKACEYMELMCCYEDHEGGACPVEVTKRCLDKDGRDTGEFVLKVPVKEITKAELEEMKGTCCVPNPEDDPCCKNAQTALKRLTDFLFVGAPWACDDEPACHDLFRPLSPICCISPEPEKECTWDPCMRCKCPPPEPEPEPECCCPEPEPEPPKPVDPCECEKLRAKCYTDKKPDDC